MPRLSQLSVFVLTIPSAWNAPPSDATWPTSFTWSLSNLTTLIQRSAPPDAGINKQTNKQTKNTSHTALFFSFLPKYLSTSNIILYLLLFYIYCFLSFPVEYNIHQGRDLCLHCPPICTKYLEYA